MKRTDQGKRPSVVDQTWETVGIVTREQISHKGGNIRYFRFALGILGSMLVLMEANGTETWTGFFVLAAKPKVLVGLGIGLIGSWIRSPNGRS